MSNFDNDDWIARVRKAKDGEEIRKLIAELPQQDTSSTNKGDQTYFSTEPVQTLPLSA